MTASRRLRHPRQTLVIEVPWTPSEDEIHVMVRSLLRNPRGVVVTTAGIRVHSVPWGPVVIAGKR